MLFMNLKIYYLHRLAVVILYTIFIIVISVQICFIVLNNHRYLYHYIHCNEIINEFLALSIVFL